MARHGGVGDVRQTEFAEQAALFVLGRLAALAERQKSLERTLQRFCAENFALERFADQRRARAEHGDLDGLQIRIVEELFFDSRTLPAQSAALADRKSRSELGLHQPGERQVEI